MYGVCVCYLCVCVLPVVYVCVRGRGKEVTWKMTFFSSPLFDLHDSVCIASLSDVCCVCVYVCV